MNNVLSGNFPISQASSQLAPSRSLLEFEKTLFVIINMLDVLMTHLLLRTGSFYETNPIAQIFIGKWGLAGMAIFKLFLVAFVLIIANVVAIWRVGTARKLLYFGSALIGTVVIYSVYLLSSYMAV